MHRRPDRRMRRSAGPHMSRTTNGEEDQNSGRPSSGVEAVA